VDGAEAGGDGDTLADDVQLDADIAATSFDEGSPVRYGGESEGGDVVGTATVDRDGASQAPFQWPDAQDCADANTNGSNETILGRLVSALSQASL